MEVSQVVKAGIKGSIAHPESAELIIDLLESDIVIESDLIDYVKRDGSQSVDKINFNTNPTLGTPSEGDLYYDEENKALSVNLPNDVILKISQEDTFIAQNMSGATIPKGKIVHVVGTLNSQPRIALARADIISSTSILAITAEDIPNFGKGLVITRGPIEDLDTDEFFTDSIVYLSDTMSGQMMQNPPVGSSTVLTIQVGRILVSNTTTGKIFITFEKNNNLSDLADVDISNLQTNQVLQYNGSYWTNGSGIAVSAGVGAAFFLDDTPSIPAGLGPQSIEVFSLPKTPSESPESIYSTTVNNSISLLKYFLNNSQIDSTTIDAGVWVFNNYLQVSQALNFTNLVITVRKVVSQVPLLDIMGIGTTRTAFAVGAFSPSDYDPNPSLTSYIQTPNALLKVIGYIDADSVQVETLSTYTNEVDVVFSKHLNLFVEESEDIDNTSVELIETITTRPRYFINPTDRLAIAYYAKTTSLTNTTVSLYMKGSSNSSYISSPISVKHNDLIGLQGGSSTERYHINLSEYTTLQNTSGINTGDQDLSDYQLIANKSTSIITDQASDIKYPSVKSVYDWANSIFQLNLGYTAENIANKATTLASPDNVKYPTTLATQNALNLKYDASNPNGYETPSQLNTRDTNNRNRANHTGTQAATTIIQDSTHRFVTDVQLQSIGQYFETVSKNLKSYNYTLNYTSGTLTSIVYNIGSGNTITKTLNYTSGLLTSIVLSGTLPSDVINVTKTLNYTSNTLTSVSYS